MVLQLRLCSYGRFVQNFSGQNIQFGKIEKQIKCEMVNSLSDTPAHEKSSDNEYATHEVAVSGWVDNLNADSDMNDSSSVLSLESVSDKIDDQDDEFDGVELEEGNESDPSGGDDMKGTFKHTEDSTSSSRLERIKALEKKLLAREKQQSVPKEQKGQKLERVRSNEKKVVAKGNRQKAPKEQKVQKLDIPGSICKKVVSLHCLQYSGESYFSFKMV